MRRPPERSASPSRSRYWSRRWWFRERGAVVEFEQTTRTGAEAATAIGCSVGEIAKTIVFRGTGTGQAIVVAGSGDNRVSEGKVAAKPGEPLARADEEFVRATTGCAVGGVAPRRRTALASRRARTVRSGPPMKGRLAAGLQPGVSGSLRVRGPGASSPSICVASAIALGSLIIAETGSTRTSTP